MQFPSISESVQEVWGGIWGGLGTLWLLFLLLRWPGSDLPAGATGKQGRLIAYTHAAHAQAGHRLDSRSFNRTSEQVGKVWCVTGSTCAYLSHTTVAHVTLPKDRLVCVRYNHKVVYGEGKTQTRQDSLPIRCGFWAAMSVPVCFEGPDVESRVPRPTRYKN